MKIDLELLNASRRSWLSSDGPRVGPYWLSWVWTLLFCMAVALGFTVLGYLTFGRDASGQWRSANGWWAWYGRNLIVSLLIGCLIHAVFDLLSWAMGGFSRTKAWKPWQRTLFFSGIPVVCTMVAWPLGIWLAGVRHWPAGSLNLNTVLASLSLSVVLTVVFHQFFATQARRIEAEKKATEAQLRLLQAQIEPHFLFNTLANVLSLIDHDAPRAKHMLESFTEYLRASFSSLRHANSTLGQELDLLQHYLGLLKTRMEDRLQFDIDCEPDLRSAALPPLLLQPLVENAIHHGLEPKVEGGRVQVRAWQHGQTLHIEVADNGLGLHAPVRRKAGAGVALANLRQRLQTAYGHGASLALKPAEPGTLATLSLPLERQPG